MATIPHRLGSDEEIPESQDEDITSESSSDEDEELSDSEMDSDASEDSDGKTNFSLSSMLDKSNNSDNEDESGDSEQKRLNLVKNITKMSSDNYNQSSNKNNEEMRPESQFNSSSASGKFTLSAATLLGALDKSKTSEKLLIETAQVNDAKSAATVPIAKVLTDRAKRQLGYQKSKETAGQWIPLVKKHREAEHINFPLNQPEASNLTNAALSSKFAANDDNDMESEMYSLLQQSGMDERDLRKKEDQELELNAITEEEIVERRKKMAKMRSLLFYQEQKSKRLKKIKSKLYHKIRNKQQEKFNKLERERLRSLDPELAKKLDEQDAKKYAEERFTLRHRNMSKWAKNALKRGQLHKDGTKEAVEESLRIGQELRRKMNHVNDDDSSSSSDDGDSSSDDGDDESDEYDDNTQNGMAKKKTKKMISKMAKETNVPKGIMALKFMQRATDTQRQKAMEEAEDLLAELEGDGKASSKKSSSKSKNVGRRQLGQGSSYNNKNNKKANNTDDKLLNGKKRDRIDSLEGSGDEDEKEEKDTATTKGNGKNSKKSGNKKLRVSQRLKKQTKDSMKNGSFQVDKVAISAGFSTRLADTNTSNSKTNIKSSIVRWDAGDWSNNNNNNNDDDDDDDDGKNKNINNTKDSTNTNTKNKLSNTYNDNSSKNNTTVKKKMTTTTTTDTVNNPWLSKADKSSAKNNEDEEEDLGNKKNKSKNKNKRNAVLNTDIKAGTLVNNDKSSEEIKNQQSMIQNAFAGDNVEEQFNKEKQALIDEDSTEKKVPTLAGWGSWTGKGAPVQKTNRRKSKKFNKQKRKEAMAAKAKRDSRRDRDLKHVIISERRNKHVAKYNIETVPHPFKSRAEYEASLRNPLGPEWNTADTHSALVRPKVIVNAGAVIDPIKMSESYKRKLPQILKKSFEEHKKKQRKLRHAKRKTKL